MRWLLRFFRSADPMPIWLVALALIVCGYSVSIVVADPRTVDEVLAMFLLLQMMAASTGFARTASAGHFDPALVRFNRALVAGVHFVHAAWPLALAWVGVAVLDLVMYDSARPLELGRVAAFVFVSVACWALSLSGPRLAAGILWLLVIVSLVTTSPGADQYAAMLSKVDGSASELVHAAALTIVCPFLMLGDHVPPRAAVSAVLLTCSLAFAALAVTYVARRDYPLEASS